MADNTSLVPKSDMKQLLVVLSKLETTDQWFRWKKTMMLHFKSKGLWHYIAPDAYIFIMMRRSRSSISSSLFVVW